MRRCACLWPTTAGRGSGMRCGPHTRRSSCLCPSSHVRRGSHARRGSRACLVPADCASSGVRGASAPDTVHTASDTGGMPVRFRMGSTDEHILRYRACYARSVRKNAARRVRHNARSHWPGHSMAAPWALRSAIAVCALIFGIKRVSWRPSGPACRRIALTRRRFAFTRCGITRRVACLAR